MKYVVSDIHGCYEEFMELLEKISFSENDEFLKEMQESYQHKFAKKPEVIEGNMKALTMTLQELAPALQ